MLSSAMWAFIGCIKTTRIQCMNHGGHSISCTNHTMTIHVQHVVHEK